MPDKDKNPPRSNTMQLAEILSDLTSLRLSDPAAALALVSARISPDGETPAAQEEDVDLKRAKDLLQLHYAVKEKHQRGELGAGLAEARRAVERAVGA